MAEFILYVVIFVGVAAIVKGLMNWFDSMDK